MPPKKRLTPFQKSHSSQYAVRVSQRNTLDQSVILAECLFCVHFGRETKIGSKRQATNKIKYFSMPFRSDNYKQHHKREHTQRWAQYLQASVEEKKTFFEDVRLVAENEHTYSGKAQVIRRYLINAPIVSRIIGDLLLDPEEVEGKDDTRDSILQCFEDFSGDSEDLEEGEGVDRLCAVIKNPTQFYLVIDYLRVGCTFRQSAHLIDSTENYTDTSVGESCSEHAVAKYARFACAINLQKLSELMEKTWTFSIVLDTPTHLNLSAVDIRIRLHIPKSGIRNFHVLAIPDFNRHTPLAIFNAATMFFDALCPDWKQTIIGVSANVDNGRLSEVASLFQKEAGPNFFRLFCGAPQLDVVLQHAYIHFGNEFFYVHLTSLISWLRRQQNLISNLRWKVPKVADTHWGSMDEMSSWFKLHRVAVDSYIAEKRPSCSPSPKWWIMMMVIDHFSNLAMTTFKHLQRHGHTASLSRSRLASLQASFLLTVVGKGPLMETEANFDESEWIFSHCRRFVGSIASAKAHVLNMGSFIVEKFRLVPPAEVGALLKDVARLYISAAAGINQIIADLNNTNQSCEQMPAVLPHQLATLQHADFCAIVGAQRQRLLVHWTASAIDIIEQDHQDLLSAYHTEPTLRSALSSCTDVTSFDAGWALVQGRFGSLYRFSGGLFSAFQGTAQEERKFSILKSKNDTFPRSLTNLSLEAILHARQFAKLAKV